MMASNPAATGRFSPQEIERRVRELAPWFHNLRLGDIQTAPEHFLGDYPMVKWQQFGHSLPDDLRGKTVLDIGCNGGFYSIEMKRRGAEKVVGIDSDDGYLAQATFAAQVSGMDIDFRQLSVYEVGELGEKFDLVLFMGVFYHLRHPLLALDLIREHVVKDLFVFQAMQRGSDVIEPLREDYPFAEQDIFDRPGFPCLYFIEKKYSGDPSNWWVPNRACVEALLRSAGFAIEFHPEREVYICRSADLKDPPQSFLLKTRSRHD
jgi:tRNA (mo5U34)-methyltransferase